ncbi:HtaA domain-containing protein [Kitasatospora sp. MAA4]|uniref:HtaA domain-containing protein n=1 Tax=Kitasatospora sp. MAA4 TaxID=3035093 RepID=UPI002475B7F2|nr:HtaA domain-containing protein [Kitasatospora sp. MAA4]
MTIFKNNRTVVLTLVAVAALGATAAAAGPELPIKGTATLCLTQAAAQSLATDGVTLTGTGAAQSAGNCVTFPGSGALSMDLLSGDLPLQGGMQFAGAGHTLDVTNLRISVTNRADSADVSVDGAPATSIDFVHFTIDPTKVVLTPTTAATSSPIALRLTSPGADAFTASFTHSPVAPGEALFDFTGKGTLTNPLGGFGS